MVPVVDGAGDHHGVGTMMATPIAAAVIIEGDRAVMAMMEAVTFVVDDHGRPMMVIIVPVICADDDIGLGG